MFDNIDARSILFHQRMFDLLHRLLFVCSREYFQDKPLYQKGTLANYFYAIEHMLRASTGCLSSARIQVGGRSIGIAASANGRVPCVGEGHKRRERLTNGIQAPGRAR